MNATCFSCSKKTDVYQRGRTILSYASIASGGRVLSMWMKKGKKRCLRNWDVSPVNDCQRALGLVRSSADSATNDFATTMRYLEEIRGTM